MEPLAPDSRDKNAHALNQALVDRLCSAGIIRSPRVEAAFRFVLRHAFLAGVPLEEVYADRSIPVKVGECGELLSSSSQPTIMAIMLEQLDLQPGHRVLEVGAGSGFNAALIAHIVGETGRVVTVDIDPDLAVAAREHLAAVGCDRVQVVCADGGYGYPEAAPYDRILLTVGAWDIAPAWWEQMAPGGRLVLPLSIAGGGKAIAFARVADRLDSLSIRDCGFIALRGAFADPHPRRAVQLGPDPGLEVWTAGPSSPDAGRLYRWLTGSSVDWETGVQVSVREIVGGLWMWIALHEPDLGRLVGSEDGIARDIVPPLIGLGQTRKVVFTPALLAESGLAALMRPPGQPAPLLDYNDLFAPGPSFALHVRQFGTASSLARRLIVPVQAWEAAGRPASDGLRVRAYRRDAGHVPAEGEIVVEKRWTRLVLDWPA
jgi:protein-L-isoaspartate(D-aspartate) O-methyltransferase